ncbi:MAG: hypothetical protein J7521_08865 [Caulobacter sp.]|nr:hypothetical protein [Caulobacter sp.]
MFASRFVLAAALIAAPLTAPVLAHAEPDDEVVATAARATLAPPTEAQLAKAKADAKAQADADHAASPVTTREQIAAWLADAPPVERVDNGPVGYGQEPEGPVKRQIHGEAGVSVGTGGYRSAYVSTLIPIGEASTLGVAVGQTDYGKNGRYVDYAGYPGYGYGYGYNGLGGFGYDGYGYGRGGRTQSLALSLDVRGGSSKRDTPEGCAPGFRDGDRYVEPLWVTEMRGRNDSCSAAERR